MNRKTQFFTLLFSVLLVAMLLLGASAKTESNPEETYRHIGVFTEVLSKIKSDYVEDPDMKNVTLGALNGLLESIDPYASYLGPDQYKQYQAAKSASKADVGLILAKRFGYISIVSAVPGSPADKAGLSTGDMIETLNNVSTRDMPLAYADIMLHGEPGSTVEISAIRLSKPEPQKMTLTRAAIATPPVTSRMLEDGIGYVQVRSLHGDREKEAAAAVTSLTKQGAKKLILDLRDCATGEPAMGARLANRFVDKALLTYKEGQKSPRQNFEANSEFLVTDSPLTVITNRGTAGGAEIAAAALLDTKRAQLVGERTYGDAAERKAITMEDGAAVILSVAKFYSPNGKAIQDGGVTPTFQINEPQPAGEEQETDPAAPKPQSRPGEDVLLKKAIEVAQKGTTESATGPVNPDREKRGLDTPVITPK